MLAMDVSDVYYDRIFMNGKSESTISEVNGKLLKAGDKVRLRISNGGASSYFWLRYAGGKIMVVANDGNDVEPVEVDRLIIAVSETYDIVVTFLPTVRLMNYWPLPRTEQIQLPYILEMELNNSFPPCHG